MHKTEKVNNKEGLSGQEDSSGDLEDEDDDVMVYSVYLMYMMYSTRGGVQWYSMRHDWVLYFFELYFSVSVASFDLLFSDLHLLKLVLDPGLLKYNETSSRLLPASAYTLLTANPQIK